MSRALILQRSIVPLAARPKYLERVRERREFFNRLRCRFRVFEEAALTGVFIEFTEADDESTLAAALAAAPEPVLDPARIYTEVELI